MDVHDYQRLMSDKEFRERIIGFEDEMNMMKDARVSMDSFVNRINQDEQGTFAGDMCVTNEYKIEMPFDGDVDLVQSQSTRKNK